MEQPPAGAGGGGGARKGHSPAPGGTQWLLWAHNARWAARLEEARAAKLNYSLQKTSSRLALWLMQNAHTRFLQLGSTAVCCAGATSSVCKQAAAWHAAWVLCWTQHCSLLLTLLLRRTSPDLMGRTATK